MHRSPRPGIPYLHRALTIAVTAALFALAPFRGTVAAPNFQTLHTFCSSLDCRDGNNPIAALLIDQSGNLFGTTGGGGKYNEGIVFKLVPNSSKYKEYVLHNFCSKETQGLACPNGAGPQALIMDVEGNLYGIAGDSYDSGVSQGVVFKLTHGANGWSYKTLFKFCPYLWTCPAGDAPLGGLAYVGQASGALWDGSSPLFGTTEFGGTDDVGVAYELVPGTKWKETVIHNFGEHGNLSDEAGPVTLDGAGNVYGTAAYGGKYGAGVLYKLAAGTWKETTLHNFCAQPKCADGEAPQGGVVRDAAGNLFGTASYGGSHSKGVAFEYVPGGSYTVIYNFCSLANCADGSLPLSGLVLDDSGHLFGTTDLGGNTSIGADGGGTIFELANNGAWSESVLHTFCNLSDCSDGGFPEEQPLTMGPTGGLFGTTPAGGVVYGTVFELTP